jgi:flagellar hook-associated protein 1 FlgK
VSSFSGLSVALSALQAQRRALDVAGHNVANAGTAGYTRQRAELSALGPATTYSLQGTPRTAGDGVQVRAVVRLTDEFAIARLRGQEASAAELAARRAVLSQLENRFGEPRDTGLSAQLSELWASWGDVANHPDDEASRAVLLQQAQAVVDQIAAGHAGVVTQWEQLRAQTDTLVTQVNTAAAGVADLNRQIKAAVAVGSPANELMDERDRLVLELARMTGASVRSKDDGTIDVLLGGNALVRGQQVNELKVVGNRELPDPPSPDVRIVWAADDREVALQGGKLTGNLDALQTLLPQAAEQYDAVARALADKVNEKHAEGFDLGQQAGGAFFTGNNARSLAVAITDPRKVAASGAFGKVYDGGQADAIAKLAADAAGPDAVWQKFVVSTGVLAQAASRRAATAETVRADAAAAVTSAASVDVDEEMVTMLTVQRAYEGAARMLTAVDQALDTLINRTGLVGR